jgi:hypothetical protein
VVLVVLVELVVLVDVLTVLEVVWIVFVDVVEVEVAVTLVLDDVLVDVEELELVDVDVLEEVSPGSTSLTSSAYRSLPTRSGRSVAGAACRRRHSPSGTANLRTLQDWEQGRAQPDGPARAYLLVILREPRGAGAGGRG